MRDLAARLRDIVRQNPRRELTYVPGDDGSETASVRRQRRSADVRLAATARVWSSTASTPAIDRTGAGASTHGDRRPTRRCT